MKTIYRIIASFPNRVMKKLQKNIEYYDGGSHATLLSKFDYDAMNDNWIGIYAITDDKKILKRWLLVHNTKYFHVMEMQLDHDAFLKYKKEALVHKLLIRKKQLRCGIDQYISVYLPSHEQDVIECCIMNILTYYAASDMMFPPFSIFKKKYQRAMEILMYNNTYMSYFAFPNLSKCSDETLIREMLTEVDVADDALAYGLTYPSGLQIHMEENEFEVYLRCFSTILSA